jgi:hypothetical protein
VDDAIEVVTGNICAICGYDSRGLYMGRPRRRHTLVALPERCRECGHPLGGTVTVLRVEQL